tara:strand:+ start:221 stop:1390 length:1170 start_codon:yes stop_codon:yes gene_type:complete
MVAVNDRVKETTTTTGTGTVNLAGAAVGFETFVAGIGNGNTTYYCIAEQGGAAFEIGIGTVTDATPDTLSRTTVLSSSNSDSLVDFAAGTKDVFCTLPASKAVIEDANNNVNIGANIIVGGTVDGVDIATRDGVLTSTTTTANAALPKSGGAMSGNITMAGTETVDGRDLSVDGTKLDGIEASADVTDSANVGTSLTGFPTGTDAVASDLVPYYDVDAGAWEKSTVTNLALQGPAGSPGTNGTNGTNGSPGPPGPPGPSGTITNTSYQMTALGVGTAAGPTGQIRATSNITAYYSDSRLKDFEGPIDSALDKVKSLTGYYFKENDLARSFGYDNEKRQVGVSAQEVESVLPEVVTEAPFNADYKSVWYEKLVPLLIEAIKELDDKKKDK